MRRKPTALKILQGKPGHHPLNLDEPVPDKLDPAIPDELDDPVARAEWDRAIVPAIRIGQVTSADRGLAITHCELWALRRSQLKEAGPQNVIAAGANNYPMPNPALTMAAKTLHLLLKVDGELGFSPVSRSRVIAAGGVKRGATFNLDAARAKFFGTSKG